MRKRYLVPTPGHIPCWPSRFCQYDDQKVWTIGTLKGTMTYIRLRKEGVVG